MLWVMARPESGWVVGVHYAADTADRFDEFRTGLDHLAFGVESRAELEAWEFELAARGVTLAPAAERRSVR
jgi:glyoxylase I family protein